MNWKLIKAIFLGVYLGLAFPALITFGILTGITIYDGTALNDSHLVNFLSLGFAFISIPSAIIQLFSLTKNLEKKELILTGKCPRCKETVEFRLREAD